MPSPGIYIGDLMVKMISGKTGEISRVAFTPGKKPFPKDETGETHLPRLSPEEAGVPSGFVEDMLRRLKEAEGNCNMHRLMMVRHGAVICDCGFGPYTQDCWHVTYSMCKSVVGMAIGLLIDEDKLSPDDRLGDYISYPKSGFSLLRGGKHQPTEDITVRQLLNMSSGASFNESGAVSGNNWTQSFMDSSLNFEPGTKFEYNSMNSYMLSAILSKITNESMMDYLKPRLFTPMGITRALWLKSPEGYNKGGWGMYMRIEDMAKLGLLYMQNGVWEGKQLIPRAWVEESRSAQMETGKENAPAYGYQLWLSNVREGAFTFNGMLGQDVFCYPDVDTIVITNAGNDDVFQQSDMSHIIHDMMRTADTCFSDTPYRDFAAQARLETFIRSCAQEALQTVSGGGWQKHKVAVQEGHAAKKYLSTYRMRRTGTGAVARGMASPQIFRRYVMESLNGALYETDVKSTGVMPLMLQIVQNNFTDGIGKIGFHLDADGTFYTELYEGDAVFSLPCTFGGAGRTTELLVHDESYLVCVQADARLDEEERLELFLKISFLEEAATRMISVRFDKQLYPASRLSTMPTKAPLSLDVQLDETPGTDMMIQTLKRMTTDAPSPGVLISTIQSTGALGVINDRVRATIRPVLHLTRI